jgi:glyoxylase-like metal-dependent hydrolase (beta-lactamase superfamily II)
MPEATPEVPSEAWEADRLRALGVLRLRAPNPGPLTLSGTNTWLVGSHPTWLVDPGPALEQHLAALLEAVAERGGLGGIALTHDHADHVEALAALRERHPAPVAAARGQVDVTLREGTLFGPLRPLATPGHSPDHFAFLADGVCFTGDAVLGEGSVFVAPDPGALSGYIAALRRLRDLPLAVLCPGHGPAVWRPREWIDGYLEHRLERERRLIEALGEGRRTTEELLDAAWSEVPAQLRAAAAVTLQAHLDKLADEGRLAPDMKRTVI